MTLNLKLGAFMVLLPGLALWLLTGDMASGFVGALVGFLVWGVIS